MAFRRARHKMPLSPQHFYDFRSASLKSTISQHCAKCWAVTDRRSVPMPSMRQRLLPFPPRGRASALAFRLCGTPRAVPRRDCLSALAAGRLPQTRSNGPLGNGADHRDRRFSGDTGCAQARSAHALLRPDALRFGGSKTRCVRVASTSLVVKPYPKRGSQHCG